MLLVEDDELLGSAAVQAGLEQSGFTVDWLRMAGRLHSHCRVMNPICWFLTLVYRAKMV